VYGIGFAACALAAGAARTGLALGPVHWRAHSAYLLAAVAVMALGLYLRFPASDLVSPYDQPVIEGLDADPQSTGMMSLALLQGNIPQGEKFDNSRGVPLALKWYGDQLQAGTTTLVVAPETALPMLPGQLPEGYLEAIKQRFTSGKQAALIGMPLGSYSEGYTNSVLGLKPGQTEPYTYSKHHLVPFGEVTPGIFKWFTAMMRIPLGDFNRGAVGQPSFEWQGQRLAPNVCYEDLFGDELAARFVDPARAPTILVNLSNIAWFGNSVAIDQHLAISRMRSLELARPMLRATNTGATVIIDHRGRVSSRLPRLVRGVLEGDVEGRQGITPFAWWASRFGLWPLWLLGLALLVGVFAAGSTRVVPAQN
jgi:apolipoprotein N-acyltransferase